MICLGQDQTPDFQMAKARSVELCFPLLFVLPQCIILHLGDGITLEVGDSNYTTRIVYLMRTIVELVLRSQALKRS